MPSPHEFIRKPAQVDPVKPWITAFMLLTMVYMFYTESQHGMLWMKMTAFAPGKFQLYNLQQQYVPMLSMMFGATFCPANIWLMLGNAYFLWVFGSLVELRLGLGRFLCLAVFAMIGGWVIQAYEAGLMSTGLYLGPGLLISSVIGSYLVFFPEKKINPGGTIGRSTKYFKNEPNPDPSASFGISPWVIIGAFIAYQVLCHFVLAKMTVHFESMSLPAAFGAFVLGMVSCAILVASASRGISGNPLKILAIKKYRQLRALDFSHEESIIGTSRMMSCPEEQVRKWIAKGSGALPQAPSEQA
jgi:membrane associated rhomboid family serine protease